MLPPKILSPFKPRFHIIIALLLQALLLTACGKQETISATAPPVAADIESNLIAGATVTNLKCAKAGDDLFECSYVVTLRGGDEGIEQSQKFELLKDGRWRMNATR